MQRTPAKPVPCRLYVELYLCLRGCSLMHPVLHCVASLNTLQEAVTFQEAGLLALDMLFF